MLPFQPLLGCNNMVLPAARGGAGAPLRSALLARRLLVKVALPLLLLLLASYVEPSATEMLAAAADGYGGSSGSARVLTYEPFSLQASTASAGLVGRIRTHEGRGAGRGGLDRQLIQQSPPRRPPAAFSEQYRMDAPVVAVAMTHIPTAGLRNRKYLMYWRVFYKNSTQSAATLDLDSGKVLLINTTKDHFCHGQIVLPDGKIALVGGSTQTGTFQPDGRRWISVYNDTRGEISTQVQMTYSRWYPSVSYTADNKVLIVGGTAGLTFTIPIPVAELWNPSLPLASTKPVTIPPTFKTAAGADWFPFIALLPKGGHLWWGDRGGSITHQNGTEIYAFPALPATFPFRTMYWFTAAIALQAMRPDPTTGEYNQFSLTIFGGAPYNAISTTPAANASARIDMYYCGATVCDNGWVIESMANQRRVIPIATVLPNGKVVIHGGAQAGFAGWKNRTSNYYVANLPAWQDLVYNPDEALGSRYTLSSSIGIIRMYHSAACLDISGKVIVTGCETCGMRGSAAGSLPSSISRSPNGDNDFRITLMTPAEIASSVARPLIINTSSKISRGSTFNVTFQGNITGATLVAPCANTHSISMNQKVLYLVVVSVANNVAVIRAPPLSQPAAAHKGYYMLFLLGGKAPTGTTYSEGIWVYLDG